jgi:ferredoxin
MGKIVATTATGDVSFEAKTGRKLVLELEDNGVDILHRCGGNAKCTTCRVEIIEGNPSPMGEAEKEILTAKNALDDKTRLSCQIRCDGDLKVKVMRQVSVDGIDAGNRPEE